MAIGLIGGRSVKQPNQQSLQQSLAQRLAHILSDVHAPLQEWITWHSVAQLPDRDTDVLVSWGDTGGVLLGAYLGLDQGWIGSDAMPLIPTPRYWARLPVGPIDSRIGTIIPKEVPAPMPMA